MKKSDWPKVRRLHARYRLDVLQREIPNRIAHKIPTTAQVREAIKQSSRERREQDGGVQKNGHRSFADYPIDGYEGAKTEEEPRDSDRGPSLTTAETTTLSQYKKVSADLCCVKLQREIW
jgi:hypothetical protein